MIANMQDNKQEYILQYDGKEVFRGNYAECIAFNRKNYANGFRDIFQNLHSVPKIENVIFQNPATIVFWADGDKTIAKSDRFDGYWEHIGLASAIVKKMFGGRSRWLHHVKTLQKEINKLPFSDIGMFDEFDLMLHYMDELYTEKKFSDMVEKYIRKSEKR